MDRLFVVGKGGDDHTPTSAAATSDAGFNPGMSLRESRRHGIDDQRQEACQLAGLGWDPLNDFPDVVEIMGQVGDVGLVHLL